MAGNHNYKQLEHLRCGRICSNTALYELLIIQKIKEESHPFLWDLNNSVTWCSLKTSASQYQLRDKFHGFSSSGGYSFTKNTLPQFTVFFLKLIFVKNADWLVCNGTSLPTHYPMLPSHHNQLLSTFHRYLPHMK